MKKILHCLIIIILSALSVHANETGINIQSANVQQTEEVNLTINNTEDEDPVIKFGGDVPQEIEISEEVEHKTLREKLKDVYHLEVEKYDRPSYLFKDILTHDCSENSVMDNWHIWGAYNAYSDMIFHENGSFQDKYVSNALNIGFDGFLKNDNADFRIMLGFPINSRRNYVQSLFADVYVGSNKIPHHRVQIGHFRPQIGMEGGNSSYTLDFLGRSQIARNFGTARRLGGRIKGDYKYIDYDFGLYSSGTFFEEWFPGAEFVGWVNLKPLANLDKGKYGKLKIGGGIDGGKRDDSFFVTGAYAGYEYKKFKAEFEWANANGYNGYYGHSRKHATGFYTTLSYMLTKKLQILACYDQFTPNKEFSENKRREMTLGLNYFVKGQALRFILNYAFCQNDCASDSHRIMLGAQILI